MATFCECCKGHCELWKLLDWVDITVLVASGFGVCEGPCLIGDVMEFVGFI